MRSENEKVLEVTENERTALEEAVMEKLGLSEPLAFGAGGNSPYSPETVVYGPEMSRGERVGIRFVAKSHNGAGHYKGRGRWRTVVICVPNADGDYAVCDAGDRDAEEVGESGLYVRPFASHEAEEKSRGLGASADAMAEAFEALGL